MNAKLWAFVEKNKASVCWLEDKCLWYCGIRLAYGTAKTLELAIEQCMDAERAMKRLKNHEQRNNVA